MDFDLDDSKIVVEKDGTQYEYDVLFTFDSEDTMKSYIGYTDNSIAENGRKNIFVSSYDPFDLDAKLEDITDERELEMVSDVLSQIDKASCE